jgi:PadR family transcriptional regulator AphA
MSINYAILGILSYTSLTGYDLKKIIQDSPFMYWSGNNNQVYKSLLELLDEGFVTSEVHHQESSPSKKIYTITKEGLAELKDWVLATPEPPEFKKTFLIQLAWADQLNTDELNTLLSEYENQIRMYVLLEKENKRRRSFAPDRTAREIHLWDLIHDNIISSYENELHWIQKVRGELGRNIGKETNRMNYRLVEKTGGKYIECISAETPLGTEQDALNLIAICFENDSNLLMLHGEALSDDFFKLGTGVAGEMLQKFINYHVKTAVIITNERIIKGKFKEMLAESHKGNEFRAFNSITGAENWLLNLKYGEGPDDENKTCF